MHHVRGTDRDSILLPAWLSPIVFAKEGHMKPRYEERLRLEGAGIALLVAPQRGTELRSKLRDFPNRATDDLLERGQEAS